MMTNVHAIGLLIFLGSAGCTPTSDPASAMEAPPSVTPPTDAPPVADAATAAEVQGKLQITGDGCDQTLAIPP